MSGYVRLYRTLATGHPAFRNDAEAMAFAWMISKAAWQPARVRYKDRTINLKRGQLVVSQRDMARAMDRDKAWVERLWKRLKREAMVEAVCEAGLAVITICNYEEYQAKGVGREAPPEAANEALGEAQNKEERNISSVSKDTSPRPWVCPVGVESQVWKDLLDNRKRRRLGTSATAWKKFQADLVTVSAQTGIPPPQLIERCTAKGWGAIYDPRDQRNERPDTNPLQSAVERIIRHG